MGHLFGLSNMLKKQQQKTEGTNKMDSSDHRSSQKKQQAEDLQPIKPQSSTKPKCLVVGSAAKVVPHCDSSDSHGIATTKTVTATTATATNKTPTSTTTTKATTATTNTPLSYLQLPYRGKEHMPAKSSDYPSKPHPQNKRIRSRRYRNR